MYKQKLIIANWKMNGTREKWLSLAKDSLLSVANSDASSVEVVLCPPMVGLADVDSIITKNSANQIVNNIYLGGQNVAPASNGKGFTGSTSAEMLNEFNCKYCIVGHSERRSRNGETNIIVASKVEQCVKGGIIPILCVGEGLIDREQGRAIEAIDEQLLQSLSDVWFPDASKLVIAYEPVWAISSSGDAGNRDVVAEEIKEVLRYIRKALIVKFGDEMGSAIKILFGGSVGVKNVADIMQYDELAGILVGAASLDNDTFKEIIKTVEESS